MRVIDENGLEAFRQEKLSPEALLELIEREVQVLVRVGVGVGKSFAVDVLLDHPDLYQRFDLVVLAAPTHAILRERAVVSGSRPPRVEMRILEPRPAERCGTRAEEWRKLEQAKCGSYAKIVLCGPCREGDPDPCKWPDLYRELKGVGLVLTTEQQLLNNRALVPMLRGRAGAMRVLVILDEGQLLDARYEVTLHAGALERFAETVAATPTTKHFTAQLRNAIARAVTELMAAPEGDLAVDAQLLTRAGTNAAIVQEVGIGLFGNEFLYVGFDLASLAWSSPGERWKDEDGTLRFIARPYLGCHVLVLSAHLSGLYAGHRLGGTPIASPFDGTRFLHSGTRILNVKNRRGAQRHFRGDNRRQILDVFAVILLRNIREGRSTVLVSRKKSKLTCAEHLRERLAGWGEDVRFATDEGDVLPGRPDPRVIPIIHYGVLGVNDYEEYESLYCLQGYYVSSGTLNRNVQEFEPDSFRAELEIVYGTDGVRRARLAERGQPDLDRSTLGNMYLRRLEVDPVVQAAGRVRFLTRPRDVVFFQMADLAAENATCERAFPWPRPRGKRGWAKEPHSGR